MQIYNLDQPTLVTKAKEVSNENILQAAQLGKDMLQLMYKVEGIGLAANQVGLLERIFVMDVSLTQDKPWIVINPKLVKTSAEKKDYLEGCLSIPGVMRNVKRPANITVEYLNQDGEKQTSKLSGLQAVCFQHELDHLNGVLFIDYLAPKERRAALAEYQEIQVLLKQQENLKQ